MIVFFYTDFYDGSCPVGLQCGCQYCTPFIFVDEFAGTYTKKVDFWTSGHYSRLVHATGVSDIGNRTRGYDIYSTIKHFTKFQNLDKHLGMI